MAMPAAGFALRVSFLGMPARMLVTANGRCVFCPSVGLDLPVDLYPSVRPGSSVRFDPSMRLGRCASLAVIVSLCVRDFLAPQMGVHFRVAPRAGVVNRWASLGLWSMTIGVSRRLHMADDRYGRMMRRGGRGRIHRGAEHGYNGCQDRCQESGLHAVFPSGG